MTLQVVLGGNDGILIATDTKQLALSTSSLIGDRDRRVLETAKVRSGQSGASKVLLSKDRKIAIAYSGSEIVRIVAASIIERLNSLWGECLEPFETLCKEEWSKLPADARDSALSYGENALLVAHSERREAFKLVFGKDDVAVGIFCHRKGQKLVLLGGDIMNPAGMLLERYLPQRPPSINRLACLAADYILMGGKLNSGGIDGLAIYFSKGGKTFEEIHDDIIRHFYADFERLDKDYAARLTRLKRLAVSSSAQT
jgi:hypothetical protein